MVSSLDSDRNRVGAVSGPSRIGLAGDDVIVRRDPFERVRSVASDVSGRARVSVVAGFVRMLLLMVDLDDVLGGQFLAGRSEHEQIHRSCRLLS